LRVGVSRSISTPCPRSRQPRSLVRRRHSKRRGITIYDYIEWDENEILSVIQGKLGWRNSAAGKMTWRMDCCITYLMKYLLQHLAGFTMVEDYLSVMIREGRESKEKALEKLKTCNDIDVKSLEYVCSLLEIEYSDLSRAVEKRRRVRE
jgi:hypothetical protein